MAITGAMLQFYRYFTGLGFHWKFDPSSRHDHWRAFRLIISAFWRNQKYFGSQTKEELISFIRFQFLFIYLFISIYLFLFIYFISILIKYVFVNRALVISFPVSKNLFDLKEVTASSRDILTMLIRSRTTQAVVFWQWVNQSFNALVNYTNRNANSPITTNQLGVAYISATLAAMITAIGCKSYWEKRASPLMAVSFATAI